MEYYLHVDKIFKIYFNKILFYKRILIFYDTIDIIFLIYLSLTIQAIRKIEGQKWINSQSYSQLQKHFDPSLPLMATSGIISAYLRRSKLSLLRPTIISLSSSSPLPTTSNSTLPLFSRHTTSFRYFSAQPSDSDFTHQLNSVTESELRSLGYIDGSQVSDAAGTLLDDLHLPIRCVVSLLDGYHDLTGLPW